MEAVERVLPYQISVLGAGPHGHQIAALLRARGVDARLFDDELPSWKDTIDGADDAPWVIGAAWPKVRALISHKAGFRDQPAAWVDGPSERTGGIIIFPGAQIGDNVIINRHVHIEFNAVISHGCTLGDFVTVCPGAVLAGEVTVEEEAFIGANATIIHGGIVIGSRSVIGAGAVVTKDVPRGATVAGVPAKVVR